MLCPFCATENPEDAVYCKRCGHRMDAKINCPACGALNDGDAVFCNMCGKRIDDGPCASCNAHDVKDATHVCDEPHETKQTLQFDWKKLLKIFGRISAISAVFFSFLFLFFTGVKTEISTSLAQILSYGFDADSFLTGLRESMNIYYFFGKGYRDVKETLDILNSYYGGYDGFYATTSYVTLAFGTIVSAGMLVAVSVLAILAAVRFIKGLLGKSNKPIGPLAVATYFTYLGCALALLALYNQSAALSGNALSYLDDYGVHLDSSDLSAGIRFNGATTAGIVLGGIFVGLYLIASIALRGKKLISKRSIIDSCVALAGMVFALLFVGFASGAMGGFVMTESVSTYHHLNVTARFSPLTMLQLIAAQYMMPNSYEGQAGATQVLLYLVTLLSLAVIVLGVVNVFGPIKALLGKRTRLVIPIVLATVTVCYLIIGILTVNYFIDVMPLPDEGIRANYTTLILTTVFAFLSLLASTAPPIINRVLDSMTPTETTEN